MKVLLFCSTDLNKVSGSQIRARLIADGLLQLGVELVIVSGGVPEELASRCVMVSRYDGATGWYNLLAGAVREFQPDFIYVITEAFADIARLVAREAKVHVAIDLHGIGVVEILELGSGYGNRWQRICDSIRWLSAVPRADIVTLANPKLIGVVSPFARRVLELFGMTDVTLFQPEGEVRRPGIDKNKVQVLYAGNYLAWQGIDLLMAAICELNRVHAPCEFTLVGSFGRSERFFERWGTMLQANNVHILDFVPYEDVPLLYRGADVLVIPRPMMLSTYLAFPQKLVDYLASGKTVVATDIAPHRWALEATGAGILCPPTPEGIAGGILQALDPDVRTMHGTRARSMAVERFCHLRQCRSIQAAFSLFASR